MGRIIICGTLMWLLCIIVGNLYLKSPLFSTTIGKSLDLLLLGAEASEFERKSEGMNFQDWSKIVATEESPKWRQSLNKTLIEEDDRLRIHRQLPTMALKEWEHHLMRESLQKWLTPTEKWHFVIGYSNIKALRMARRFGQGARVQYFPAAGNSSLHYFLTFTNGVTAEVLRSKNRFFHVVELLLPYLKIEDLTLGKLIRDQQYAKQARESSSLDDEKHELKATLADGALTMLEVQILARRWQIVLQLESQDPLLSREHISTLRYMNTVGQTGIHNVVDEEHITYYKESLLFANSLHKIQMNPTTKTEMRNSDPSGVQSASAIKCQGEAIAIACSPITKTALQGTANFMALHAVVQLVELNPRYEVFNKWAKYVTQSVSGKHLPIFNKGLFGEGEVIACADTGIDMDHCFFRDKHHPVPFNTVNVQARKVVQYMTSWGDKTDFAEGHGTHVAGSIAGDIEEGSNQFAGMAPAAKIAFCDLGSNSSNLKAPIELGKGIFNYGYMAGARIFSNSWGVLRQGYSSNSHDVDSFSYLNENVLIVFAVGNQGTFGKGSVASPASSKNCLAVGASINAAASLVSQSEDYSTILIKPSTVAPFSSAGPTLDGRIKPDVLAPGMVVWSSVPAFGQGPPEHNCQVGPKQGTSSSTPVAAGLASLARQYFREGYYPSGKKIAKDGFIPSGALLKAVMIHSAVPEQRHVNSSGINDLKFVPDYVQGFGLVVLEKVLVFAKPRSKHQPSCLFVLSGQKDGAIVKHKSFQTFTLTVTSSKEPLQMTMVWMDPPAAPSSLHPMVNDLNLRALCPNNKTLYPNGLNEEDYINNVEVIHVTKPKKGRWKVTVEAARVISDKQPYALLVTGSFRYGTNFSCRERIGHGSNVYPYNANATSNADMSVSTIWEYSCCFCLFMETWCLIVVLIPLFK